jgi:hypothetical protein
MGWLARQFGLACDNVARFEVVSANGEILHASQSQNPDLFRGAARRRRELRDRSPSSSSASTPPAPAVPRGKARPGCRACCAAAGADG